MCALTGDSYDILSRYYDLEFDGFDADVDMYLQFATNMDGPVLELGCGSGRVLRHLTSLGLPLCGVDTSASMLRLARQRLPEDVELAERDMRDLSGLERGPFALAFSAINTFLHLPDVESQLMALASIASVTAEGGVLIIDAFVPHPDYLAGMDGRVEHEFSAHLPSGSRVDKWTTRAHDSAGQTIHTTAYYDETSIDGTVSRQVATYTTRYIHHFEMEHLLARGGWEIVSVYGGYDLSPLDSESERMIFLATPGGRD